MHFQNLKNIKISLHVNFKLLRELLYETAVSTVDPLTLNQMFLKHLVNFFRNYDTVIYSVIFCV